MSPYATIGIEVMGVEQVRLAINRLVRELTDLRGIWPAFHMAFLEVERQQFSTEGGTGAHGHWPELTQNYHAWKMRHYPGMPILQREQRLMNSLTAEIAPGHIFEMFPNMMVTGTEVTDKTGRGYAGYHQMGTPRMVPRPPVDISESSAGHYFGIATFYAARRLELVYNGVASEAPAAAQIPGWLSGVM